MDGPVNSAAASFGVTMFEQVSEARYLFVVNDGCFMDAVAFECDSPSGCIFMSFEFRARFLFQRCRAAPGYLLDDFLVFFGDLVTVVFEDLFDCCLQSINTDFTAPFILPIINEFSFLIPFPKSVTYFPVA